MRGWWPLAAIVSAAFFAVSLTGLLVAPSFVAICDEGFEAAPGGAAATLCAGILTAARSLVVGSGALLAAALVGILHAFLVDRALGRHRDDPRPLVSIRGRRRL